MLRSVSLISKEIFALKLYLFGCRDEVGGIKGGEVCESSVLFTLLVAKVTYIRWHMNELLRNISGMIITEEN
jgi:hypothetical protein